MSSVKARAEREAAEKTRQQRELETARELAETQSRSAQRLRRLAFGFSVVLVLAIGAAWLAFDRGEEAKTQAKLTATSEAKAVMAGAQALDAQATAQAGADFRATAEAAAGRRTTESTAPG